MSRFLRTLSLILGIMTKLRSLLRLVVISGAVATAPGVQASDLPYWDGANQPYWYNMNRFDGTFVCQDATVPNGGYVVTLQWKDKNGALYIQSDYTVNISGGAVTTAMPINMANFDPRFNPPGNAPYTVSVLQVVRAGFGVWPGAKSISGDTTLTMTHQGVWPAGTRQVSSITQYTTPFTVHIGAKPPETRSIDISVGVKNWEPTEYKLAIAARGPSQNAIPIQIGVVQASRQEKQTIDGKEKTVTIPGEALIEGTLQEPTPNAWNNGSHYGYILKGDGTVLTDSSGVITIASATKYNDGLHMFSDIGVPPPPLPDDIIEKPEAPETPPGETPGEPKPPKPGTTPPTDPTGTPITTPTPPTVPPMDPNIVPWDRPMTGVGGSGAGGQVTPHEFYNAIRSALGDDAASGDGEGQGENGSGGIGGVSQGEVGDATGVLENRGDLDNVQGKLDETTARIQNAKATLAGKLNPLTKNEWMNPTLGKTLQLNMGANRELMGGKTLNISLDLNSFGAPITAIRAGMLFLCGIVFTLATTDAIRKGIA